MTDGCNVRKEGDLYMTVSCYGHSLELRYGYYEESDRINGEPVVLYPDLKNNPVYTEKGYPLVTAIQIPCKFYEATDSSAPEDCCSDCIFYGDSRNEIDICLCESRKSVQAIIKG